jgi:hypothetical protein
MLKPSLAALELGFPKAGRSHNSFYASGASGDCEGWQLTGSF